MIRIEIEISSRTLRRNVRWLGEKTFRLMQVLAFVGLGLVLLAVAAHQLSGVQP